MPTSLITFIADKSTSLKGLFGRSSSTKNLLANKQLQRLGQIQGIVI
jgi:hypothetical protein